MHEQFTHFPPKFLQKPSPPIFFMVHLLHRLYGVDAPGPTELCPGTSNRKSAPMSIITENVSCDRVAKWRSNEKASDYERCVVCVKDRHRNPDQLHNAIG